MSIYLQVTFKNTPVRHHPARYKAELLHHPLDTWEEIRSLDEVENWTERTQVVTREDHQLHIESTKVRISVIRMRNYSLI